MRIFHLSLLIETR